MNNVSLLPYEYRVLNKQARKKDNTLLIAIAIMICFLLAYIALNIASARKNSTLKEAEAVNSALEKQIASLEGVEVLNNKVSKLSENVKAAAGTTPVWAKIIADIGNTVKPTTLIRDIKMDYKEDAGKCVINGIVYDIDSLSVWLNELEDISGIGKIKYTFSKQANTLTNEQIEFELTITLLPGSAFYSQEVIAQ